MGVAPISFKSPKTVGFEDLSSPRDSLQTLQDQQQVRLDSSQFLTGIHSKHPVSRLNWANEVEVDHLKEVTVPLNDVIVSSNLPLQNSPIDIPKIDLEDI